MSEPHIPDAVRHLDRELRPFLEEAHDEASEGIAEAYRGQAEEVGAVRSGRFRDRIHAREATRPGDVRERIVESEDVSYSDIIERGRTDTDKYPGRYPAERAIKQHAGRVISDAFDNQFNRAGIYR